VYIYLEGRGWFDWTLSIWWGDKQKDRLVRSKQLVVNLSRAQTNIIMHKFNK